MSAAYAPAPSLYLPGRRLLNRREFEQLADSGIFAPEERLELIEGEIITGELPMKTPHATGVRRTEIKLRQIFFDGYDVRGQLPIALSEQNEPLPDIAVVVGTPDDYEIEHPMTAVLIIEVSDTTLQYDKTTKASLYARAGIPEYGILNLNERILERHRNPIPMADKPLGYGYQEIVKLSETETFSPLAAPDAVIAIADLLPKQHLAA